MRCNFHRQLVETISHQFPFPPSPANNIDRVGKHAYIFLVQFSGRLDHTNIRYGGKGEVMLSWCEIVSINRSKNHSRRRIKEVARVSIKHADKQQIPGQSALTEVIDCRQKIQCDPKMDPERFQSPPKWLASNPIASHLSSSYPIRPITILPPNSIAPPTSHHAWRPLRDRLTTASRPPHDRLTTASIKTQHFVKSHERNLNYLIL